MSAFQSFLQGGALSFIASMLVGCDEPNCRVPLSDCDPEVCHVVQGWPVNAGGERGQRQPAGCWSTDDDRVTATVETGGRAPDGQCWLFSDPLLPYGTRAAKKPSPQMLAQDRGPLGSALRANALNGVRLEVSQNLAVADARGLMHQPVPGV